MSAVGLQQDAADALKYKFEHIMHNDKVSSYIKSSSIAGAFAGLLGLTSWQGIFWYFASSFLVGFLTLAYNAHFTPKAYFKSGALEAVTKGMMDNVLSYVLFWVLLYGIVHVYE